MPLIELNEISVKFGNTLACDRVSLRFDQGLIYGLIGENGAGKSTLMNVVMGQTLPQTGQMRFEGHEYRPKSARDAFAAGFSMVHQHYLLASQLTILQNLALVMTSDEFSLKKIDLFNCRKKIEILLAQLEWSLPLDEKIYKLSVSEQQRVEIVKALIRQPNVIIFDEPTAVLSPLEIPPFFKILKSLKENGKTIIIITHKLAEIFLVADHVAVLRKGKLVASGVVSQFTEHDLADIMIGAYSSAGRTGQPDLAIERAVKSERKLSLTMLKKEIQFGQIVGLAGVEGNGQSEFLAQLKTQLQQSGISFSEIKADRYRDSLFNGLKLYEHVFLRSVKIFSRWGFVKWESVKTCTDLIIKKFDVRPANSDYNCDQLSGGNQQKFFVGRELQLDSDVCVACYPTRGVDIGAQKNMFAQFKNFASRDKLVFILTSDLDEVLHQTDLTIVFYRGQLFGPYQSKELQMTDVAQIMAGLKL